mgnify:CR=1 FL=1
MTLMYVYQLYDLSIISMALISLDITFFFLILQCDMIFICFHIQNLYFSLLGHCFLLWYFHLFYVSHNTFCTYLLGGSQFFPCLSVVFFCCVLQYFFLYILT